MYINNYHFSGYGKLGEKVHTYTRTVIGDDKKLAREAKSAYFKSENLLTMENGEHECVEISMDYAKIEDDKPLIMAKAILQHSKLHFLKFVYEVLWKYFTLGSFKLNYCDTDSLCICKL